MKDDGTMARLPDLVEFAPRARPQARHHRRPDRLPQPQRVAGQARDRARHRDGVRTLPPGRLPREAVQRATHLALVRGEIDPRAETLVRVHEPLVAARPPRRRPGHALVVAARGAGAIAAAGTRRDGAAQLLRERRQLIERVVGAAREAVDAGAQRDLLTYGIGAQILRELKVGRMRAAWPRRARCRA